MASVDETADIATTFTPLSVLARLASGLLQPSLTFQQLDLAPLTQAQFEALNVLPVFAAPMSRYYYKKHIAPYLKLSRKQCALLTATAEGRLAVVLLTEPIARLEQAALLVAGAAFSRQVLQATHKAERRFLRTVLGPEAFQVATLEAPILYPSLSRYGGAQLMAAENEQDETAAREKLATIGMGLLAAVSSSTSHSLGRLVLKRNSSGRAGTLPASFTPQDRQSVLRLLQRRMTSWTAFIG